MEAKESSGSEHAGTQKKPTHIAKWAEQGEDLLISALDMGKKAALGTIPR